MGIFNKLFGELSSETSGSRKELPWKPLMEESQLESIQESSFSKPQLIYKHSTTCGISSMVLNMFSKSFDYSDDHADLYFLDLHRHRPVSNEVARRFGVRHESPQLIIIDKGEVSVHRSHGAIADLDLKSYI